MKRFWGAWCACVVLGVCALAATAEDPVEKHKTGQFTIEEKGMRALDWARTVHNYGGAVKAKYHEPIKDGRTKWVTREQAVVYQVYVPANYKAGELFGVLVYINSAENGKLPRGYHTLLDKHRLIAIGADHGGNKQGTVDRHAMAVCGVRILMERYDIDPDRIYVTGTSGGGRVASQVMVMDGNLFTGGMPMIGANPCVPMQNADSRGNSFFDRGVWRKPNKSTVAVVKARSRLAFLTTEKDFNRAGTKLLAEGYQKAGFKHTLYVEEPGKGHSNLSAEWFEKAIVFADGPLVEASAKVFEAAKKAEAEGNAKDAYEAYRKAATHGRTQPFFADAKAKAAEWHTKAQAASIEAFEAVAAKKPSLSAYQKLEKDWAGYPGAEKAVAAINGLGRAELEPLKARTGTSARSAMGRYAKKWRDYKVYDEALEHFDSLAAKELEAIKKIEKQSTRHSKLLVFAKAWSPTKSSDVAYDLVNEEAGVILAEIKAIEKKSDRYRKLQTFARTYKDANVGSEALKAIEEMKKDAKGK